MNARALWLPALAAVALGLLAPAPADAIPAFARKYRQSCTTCHGPFPRLKPYGDQFAARGYRMEEGAEPARATLDVGDDLLALPRDFPLAVRFDGFVDWAPDRVPQLDLETPFVFKALTGGSIAPGVSYYTYFIVEDGGATMGIEDAWVQFTGILGLPVDVTVGQFQLCDPIVKRELRLLRLDYELLRARPRFSRADLTYDRGLMVAWHAPGELEVLAQITNGNSIGPAGETFDSDRFKTFGLRLARPFGPLRVGLFGSVGKAFADAEALAAGAGASPDQVNTTVFWGPDLQLDLGDWGQVAGQWLSRHDSNAAFDPANTGETNTRGLWLEAVVTPQGANGRTAVTALYNKVVSDDPEAERDSLGLGASWLFARNVRLVGEVQSDLRKEEWKVSAGTVLAY
jgi:hypothetical protein